MKRFWIILPAGFIALALLASFFRIGALWGLSAWGTVSPLVALAVAIVVVPQMFVKSAPDPFRLVPAHRLARRAIRRARGRIGASPVAPSVPHRALGGAVLPERRDRNGRVPARSAARDVHPARDSTGS